MDRIRIRGGKRLTGTLPISGAKNAALPLMIASLLTADRLTLKNVPNLADVNLLARILRNHGLLTTAPTIADAFLLMYVLETACQIQILAQSGGTELVQVPEPVIAGIQAQAEQVTKGLGGSLVWPGLLRKLERRDPSFRD